MADVKSIFKSKFNDFKSTLKSTSYDKLKEEYLCNDESQKVFDFDNIIKKVYPHKQPASYDALLLDENNIFCVEFKNERYSDIDKEQLHKKLINSKEAMDDIFKKNNIQVKDYNFVFCVAYKNTKTRWRRAIEKNTIQFELEQYKGKYFDEIYTNDVQFFTNEYKKYFQKALEC
ncbi:MAG: hypothetical protein U9Q04_00925 [Campylobacterota bacterium]|nr:hypothetical protein [Campylobacterota bacterium]